MQIGGWNHFPDGEVPGQAIPCSQSDTDITIRDDADNLPAGSPGKFPTERIARIIAGDDAMASHVSRAMPLWEPIFHEVEKDQDWGEVRVHNLVEYLRSIQRQPANNSSPAK